MNQKQVKLNIQGIPPEWLSYECQGTRKELIEAIYSAMMDDDGFYIIFKEACEAYEQHILKIQGN